MSINSSLRTHRLMRTNRAARIVCAVAAALAAITLTAPSASAAYVNVFGGPNFTTGDGVQFVEVAGVNAAGAAVGNVYTEASARDASFLVVRWDGSGAPAIELGLGGAMDINEAGTAIGYVTKIVGTGDPTSAAVRWDASGAATELMILGTPPCCGSFAYAFSINDAGAAVGSAEKYGVGGSFQGYHAVRWDASGTSATELESHGTTSASAINNGGTAVGSAIRFDSSGEYMGNMAVRWDASGTAATELGNLGTDSNGDNYSDVYAINDAGTAVGYATKGDYGNRAVRWDASGTAATELGILGFSAFFGYTESYAVAINDAGAAVGYANKYDGSGAYMGDRAVRWDASGTAATELGNLGTSGGFTETNVFAVNDAGIAVGYADDYDGSGTNLGERAVYWGLNGVAVDLNTLIDPASGWTLIQAHAISDTDWIGGSGLFDPDGPGGEEAYARLFLIQIPEATALPGDFDSDGDIDGADFVAWQTHFPTATGATHAQGDADGDGDVDGADFVAWQTSFPFSPGPSIAPVPEPPAILLASFVAVAFAAFRRRPINPANRQGVMPPDRVPIDFGT